ncbi:MAG: 2-amino-4-hydroxy-6-hydroxymethyldihydropteridine diphosphokinase [Chitinophagales bacterium]
MKKAILLCGSNIGERENQLLLSQTLLELGGQLNILKISSLYETAPWGDREQSAFLNQALLIETSLSPMELLHHLKDIEIKAGRVNTRKWGPRALDIDILYYGDDVIIEENTLCIPHAEVQNRAFALVPAAEIAPHWIDPRNGKTIAELCVLCPDSLPVKKLALTGDAI